jgi:tRNA 2-selenouridine synthase
VRFIVLKGLAGSGKTDLLARLAAAHAQVLDLEALAAHRGSSFGRIGVSRPQPGQRRFGALVDCALADLDPGRPVWVEDEGPHLGPLRVPDRLSAALARATTVAVPASLEERIERLTRTYGDADPAALIDATQRIRRRLGNPRTDRAISHFHAGRPEAAIRTLLEYFDEGYQRRAARDTRPELPAEQALEVVPGLAPR